MKWINGTVLILPFFHQKVLVVQEVKDKGKLTESRRKIEVGWAELSGYYEFTQVEMERFKEFERESKTKPFSFMGLQAQVAREVPRNFSEDVNISKRAR